MKPLLIASSVEQAATHLRGGIRRGVWVDEMPGAPKLAGELGVDPKTVHAALALLENEGRLVARGVGRRRRIAVPQGYQSASLRLAILIHDPLGLSDGYVIEPQHVLQEAFLFIAAQDFVTRRVMRVPEDVSLVCSDASPAFAWCVPQVSHIRWDSGPVLRRVVRWAGHVARGKEDLRQTMTKAEFVTGGTIGPVKR